MQIISFSINTLVIFKMWHKAANSECCDEGEKLLTLYYSTLQVKS